MTTLADTVTDLRAEGEELYQFLSRLKDDDWTCETKFKRWTVNDVIAHLYFGDHLGLTSYKSGEAFKAFMKDVANSGQSLVEFTRQWLKKESGRPLLERWHKQFVEMCDCFVDSDPDLRLTWAGPDMGIRMFTTARLMETWAHSWEIYDALSAQREHSDRIKHIATIGVKTFGWTFNNRKLPVPTPPPQVSLHAPSGELWEWNTPQTDNRVEGNAVEFCQVVTQVRNIADTQLIVTGDPAKQWMKIAQCFAGPPEQPPEPGSRTQKK